MLAIRRSLTVAVVAVATLVGATVAGSAHTPVQVKRWLSDELMGDAGSYNVVETWLIDKTAKYNVLPMRRCIDKKAVRQIQSVCYVGDPCVVSAKGESGNNNEYVIQKVFEVQRSPQKLKDLKPLY